MLEDATYREWTAIFNPGSYYEGDWEQGKAMKFLGPEGGGMFAEVVENRLHEFVSIKHLGMIENGVENPWESGAEVYENYTFTDKDGGTEVVVDLINVPEEYKSYFEETWPQALDKLKEIVEQ